MKIALAICPPWTQRTPPIQLGYLTAYLRDKGHKVTPFDFNIEAFTRSNPDEKYLWSRDLDGRWIKDKSSFIRKELNRWADKLFKTGANVIGISVIYDSVTICIELAKEIKRRDPTKIVIFGGSQCHRGFLTREFLNEKSVDIYVIGEGEESINEILKKLETEKKIDFCKGTIIRRDESLKDCGDREPIKDLDKIPFPDYGDLPLGDYTQRDYIAILGSRGCISRCLFCQDPQNVPHYRSRSAKNIFMEMELRYKQGYREFYFNDLVMNGDVKVLNELCDILMKQPWHKHINIGGQMKCRKEMTPSIYKKLKAVGCHQIMFGVESGSQIILDKMRKGITVKSIEQNLKFCTKAGILAEIALIVGFPGETNETFAETISLIRQNHEFIDTIAALYSLDLRTGSPIANNYEKFGLVKEEEEWYWHTKDGKNDFEWRLGLIYEVIKTANEFGIKLGFDDAHFYFFHALRYYHIYKKNYDKSFKVMEEALQYLSTKIKKCQNQMSDDEEKIKRLNDALNKKNLEFEEYRRRRT